MSASNPGQASCTHHYSFSPAKLFNVEGLVAVITGGGSGIGLIMASTLENNGATVYIVGRRLDVLETAAIENSRFNKIIPLLGDVTDRSSLLTLVETVKARHGYIDLLVNNAAIARNLLPHPLPSPPPDPSAIPSIKAFQSTLWDAGTVDDFADAFASNTTSVYYTTVAFLDLLHQGNLRKQRDNPSQDPPYHSSQVLSVSSSGAFRHDAKILSISYTLSKSACTHLGKLMANLLAPWGIRSNVLAPGVWPTDMTSIQVGALKLDPDALASAVPLKRVGSKEDMAGTVLFLTSRAGAYTNGSVFLVDGGRYQGLAA